MSNGIFQPTTDLYVGMKLGATWGTAVDCDVAARRLPIFSESIVPGLTRVPNPAFHGYALQRKSRQGRVGPFTGPLVMPFDIDNCMLPMALFWGTCSAPVQVAATAAYTMTMSLNSNPSNFATLAMEQSIDLEEFDSCIVDAFTLSSANDQTWTFSPNIIARYLGWDGSTPYPAVTVALPGSSLTFKKSDPLPQFEWNSGANNKFRMNAVGGAALDDTNLIYPQDFSITLTRTKRITSTGLNAPYIDLPRDNGFVTVSGSFTLPYYTAIALREAQLANTLYKMSVLLKSDVIASANQYEFNLFLPCIEIDTADVNANSEETAMHPITFTSKIPDTLPTGMAEMTPYCTTQSTWSASPLA